MSQLDVELTDTLELTDCFTDYQTNGNTMRVQTIQKEQKYRSNRFQAS